MNLSVFVSFQFIVFHFILANLRILMRWFIFNQESDVVKLNIFIAKQEKGSINVSTFKILNQTFLHNFAKKYKTLATVI